MLFAGKRGYFVISTNLIEIVVICRAFVVYRKGLKLLTIVYTIRGLSDTGLIILGKFFNWEKFSTNNALKRTKGLFRGVLSK